MPDATGWVLDVQGECYTCTIGPCTLRVSRNAHGQWATELQSGRRAVIQRAFPTLEEAQAWGESEAAVLNRWDRRRSERQTAG